MIESVIDCRAVMKAVIVSMIVYKLKVSSTFYQPPQNWGNIEKFKISILLS